MGKPLNRVSQTFNPGEGFTREVNEQILPTGLHCILIN